MPGHLEPHPQPRQMSAPSGLTPVGTTPATNAVPKIPSAVVPPVFTSAISYDGRGSKEEFNRSLTGKNAGLTEKGKY